jgi:hypothetical protein
LAFQKKHFLKYSGGDVLTRMSFLIDNIASSAFVQVERVIERLNIAIVLCPENAIMILMSTLTFPILVVAGAGNRGKKALW